MECSLSVRAKLPFIFWCVQGKNGCIETWRKKSENLSFYICTRQTEIKLNFPARKNGLVAHFICHDLYKNTAEKVERFWKADRAGIFPKQFPQWMKLESFFYNHPTSDVHDCIQLHNLTSQINESDHPSWQLSNTVGHSEMLNACRSGFRLKM